VTTQNFELYRSTKLNNGAAGTYYYPDANGTTGDGFDHIEVQAMLSSGIATDTLMLSVQSDDGSGTWGWDETRGMYLWSTGTYGNVFVVNLATSHIRLTLLNHNAARWRVCLVIDVKGVANNSSTIGIRKVKV
jgi:hypothetical protein